VSDSNTNSNLANPNNNYRPSKDVYYWNIAKEVAQRTTCMSVKGGTVIINGDQIIATGYIGAPRGTKDCYERGNCLRRELNVPSGTRYELCRSVHSEQNALINAARAGVSVLGSTLYLYFVKKTTTEGDKFVKSYPCLMCKKLMINAGVKRFVGNDENGNVVSYNVEDWVKDWSDKDIIDDKVKYDSKYTSEEAKANKERK
jgi:dCMP deaminase